MSQYYVSDGVTLWNPASGVSRLFLGQVRLFEDALGQASGFGVMESDECEVDSAVLNQFAKALVSDARMRHHNVWPVLADGLVVTVLAVAERAGLLDEWGEAVDDHEADLRGRARALARTLPT